MHARASGRRRGGPAAGAARARPPHLVARGARRVVVKLGTAVLTDGGCAADRVRAVVESVVSLRREGREVLIVSSGAVRLGADRLGLAGAAAAWQAARACAAVGQGRLMASYTGECERLGVPAAQLLLTGDDFRLPERSAALRTTLGSLLQLGVLPVINENDAVAAARSDGPAGSHGTVGDNDRLAALVAARVDAGLLLILTDVAGLLTADPRGAGRARLIPVVRRLTPRLERLAGGPRHGRGGMRSKLEAARIATGAGCAVVVADGREPGVIERVCAGEHVGTLFLPRRAEAADG